MYSPRVCTDCCLQSRAADEAEGGRRTAQTDDRASHTASQRQTANLRVHTQQHVSSCLEFRVLLSQQYLSIFLSLSRTFTIFKTHLKSHLFNISFPSVWLYYWLHHWLFLYRAALEAACAAYASLNLSLLHYITLHYITIAGNSIPEILNIYMDYYYYYSYYYKMYWIEWCCHRKLLQRHLTMKKRNAVSAVSLECQMMMKTELSSVPSNTTAMMTISDICRQMGYWHQRADERQGNPPPR